MNKLVARAQQIGKKAIEIKNAVEALPAQAAKLRTAVTMTGGELQQFRADLEHSIHGLKVGSEDNLLKAMREINDHANVFEEAGYDLNGMDLDLAFNQCLAVNLDKFEDVPNSLLRNLLGKQTSETIRSIVAGIIKAEETAAIVELSHLKYKGLVIHAGPVPIIRMCWRDHSPSPAADQKPATIQAAPETSAQVQQSHAPVSMFDLRPLPTGAVHSESTSAVPSLPGTNLPVVAHEQPPKTAWSQDALERFKRMPSISKYGS